MLAPDSKTSAPAGLCATDDRTGEARHSIWGGWGSEGNGW